MNRFFFCTPLADILLLKYLNHVTLNVFQVAECHAAPAGFSPSLDWQQRQVSNFSDVRQVIKNNYLCYAYLKMDPRCKRVPLTFSAFRSEHHKEQATLEQPLS